MATTVSEVMHRVEEHGGDELDDDGGGGQANIDHADDIIHAQRAGAYKFKPPPKPDSDSDDEQDEDPFAGFVYSASGKIQYVPPKSLGLKEWQPNDIPLDCFVIEYGKRRTGKSFFTRKFFSLQAGKYYVVTVHTRTKMNGFFQKFVDPDFIYKGYNEQAMSRLFDKQEMLVGMQYSGVIPERAGIYSMTWFDDVLSEKSLRYQPSLIRAATEGRHYKMCVGINTQHGTALPPSIRGNADIVVIFTQLHMKTKEMLVDEYFSNLNKRTAMELIDLYTLNHGCLVLELWRNETDPRKYMFHYKADEPPPFQVLAPLPRSLQNMLHQVEDEQRDGRKQEADPQY